MGKPLQTKLLDKYTCNNTVEVLGTDVLLVPHTMFFVTGDIECSATGSIFQSSNIVVILVTKPISGSYLLLRTGIYLLINSTWHMLI